MTSLGKTYREYLADGCGCNHPNAYPPCGFCETAMGEDEWQAAKDALEDSARKVKAHLDDLRETFKNDSTSRMLKNLLALAYMENASFGFPSEIVNGKPHMGEPYEMTLDELIKSRTYHWRTSWLIPAIEELQRRHTVAGNLDTLHQKAQRLSGDIERDTLEANLIARERIREANMLDELRAEIKSAEARLAILREELPSAVTAGKRILQV